MSELTREQIEQWRIAWANDGLKPEVFAQLNAMCDLALAALSGVRVPVDELRIVTEFFGERNWPDTKVGNAAYALHGRLLAAAKGERDE